MKKFVPLILILTALILSCGLLFVACNEKPQTSEITVTFDPNYEGAEIYSKTFKAEDFSSLEQPTRIGHEFVKWTSDRAGSVPVTAGTLRDGSTLYAQWKKRAYDVKFMVGETLISSEKVEYQNSATAPKLYEFWDKVPEDMAFTGWDKSFESITGDLVVNATLSHATALATFVARIDPDAPTVVKYAGILGEIVPDPPQISHTGCTFVGWREQNGDMFESGTTRFFESATYEAVFEIGEPQGVKFVLDEEITSITVECGDEKTVSVELERVEDFDYSFSFEDKNGETISSVENRATFAFDEPGEQSVKVTVTASFAGETATKTSVLPVTVEKKRVDIEVSSEELRINWTSEGTSGLVTLIDARANDLNLVFTLDGEPFDDEIVLKDGGRYEIKLSIESDKYQGEKSVFVNILAAKHGEEYYLVEEALALEGESVLVGDATVKGENTLPAGSSLTLPYDGSDDGSKKTADGTQELYYIDIEKETTYLKRTLTVEGSLTINGELIVGGTVGRDLLGAFQGATSGDYAQLNIPAQSSVTVKDGGKLNNYGYIKGDGTLNVLDGGTLLTPFVIRDFRGGSSTAGTYKGSTDGNKIGVSPINQYDMPNVQALQHIEAGGKVVAHCSLFTSAIFNMPASYNKVDTPIIAKDEGLMLLTSGYMEIKTTESFDAERGVTPLELPLRYATHTNIDIFGDATLGEMSLTVNLSLITTTVYTSQVRFPLPYNFAMTIKNGGTLTVPYCYNLLPGATFTIDGGGKATVKSGAQIIVYDEEWQDACPEHADFKVYPHSLERAKLIVKGTLELEGGSGIAGDVTRADGGVIQTTGGITTSILAREGYGSRDNLSFTFHGTWSKTYDFTINGALFNA